MKGNAIATLSAYATLTVISIAALVVMHRYGHK